MPIEPITVSAIYEAGVLKPEHPLPLPEHAQVIVTIGHVSVARRTAGLIRCADPELIDRVALDPDLELDA